MLVRSKHDVDKTVAKALLAVGPPIDTPNHEPVDGYEYRAAVDADGEAVEGLAFLVPTRPRFGLTVRGRDD